MFYVVHSVPTYANPQIILAVHSTLQAAQATAQQHAQALCVQYANAEITVQQNTAELLDAHCIATYCVADDCVNITSNIAAYCSNMLQTP